ncbi:hypothetical protein OESDEN_23616 [Oesophagostomum dentatum]|uniref:Uncharacterized protein n=1 Tax=Oesophagostomum dentatum TaxID=61180 RepID=A0A0B1RVP4_OESDE|nr:hypothetical protein OESDEN_23616 [Oesophagostomum dentatum]
MQPAPGYYPVYGPQQSVPAPVSYAGYTAPGYQGYPQQQQYITPQAPYPQQYPQNPAMPAPGQWQDAAVSAQQVQYANPMPQAAPLANGTQQAQHIPQAQQQQIPQAQHQQQAYYAQPQAPPSVPYPQSSTS